MPVGVVAGMKMGSVRMIRRNLGGHAMTVTLSERLNLVTVEAGAFFDMLARLRQHEPTFKLEPVDVGLSEPSAAPAKPNPEDTIYIP